MPTNQPADSAAPRTPHLSVIIPCFDEERRIIFTLTQFQQYLAQQDYTSEILVVDDGSEDKTADLVALQFPHVRLIRYAPNRGKGYATKVGMTEARGAFTPQTRAFVFIGILGGFTTFSAFGNETMNLWRDQQTSLGFLNIGGHLVLGLAMVWLGRVLGHEIWR